jgi:hypothetical protein
VRSSSRHSTEPIGIERICNRSMSHRHADMYQRANLHWRANMDRRRDLAAVRFASPRRGPVQCSEIAIGRDVAVTIESRSDPSYSRCQISRTRTDDARPFGLAVSWRMRKTFSLRTSTPAGGARRDRTDDLLLAKQALSQLSYGPGPSAGTHRHGRCE